MNAKDFEVPIDSTIDDLFKSMGKITSTSNSSGFALITEKSKVVGVVSDSDVRKFILKNKKKPEKVTDVLQSNFAYISKYNTETEMIEKILMVLDSRGWKTKLPIKFLPVIEDGSAIGVIDLNIYENLLRKSREQTVVYGLGYVGLTVALSLAANGRKVVGIDTDIRRVNWLNEKKCYIKEPGLENLLNQNLNSNFEAKDKIDYLDRKSNSTGLTHIICLPTPIDTNSKPDTQILDDFVSKLLNHLNIGDLVILRSTIPLGYSRKIVEIIEAGKNWKCGNEFYLVFAPERTVEGNALIELTELPQVIAGATDSCLNKGVEYFQGFVKQMVISKQLEEAELIKIASNAYRDHIFAFSNQLAIVAQTLNIDINQVIENSNLGYPRNNIAKPSPGVGGPCLTKDPYFMPDIEGLEQMPAKSSRKLNEIMPRKIFDFLYKNIGEELKSKEIAVLGLAFKGLPETNDIRNSPSMEIIAYLQTLNSKLTYFDANLAVFEDTIIPNIERPSIILILNNHPKNLELVISLLENTQHAEIWIFDPWRLIHQNLFRFENNLERINYLTLSNRISLEKPK